MPNLIAAINATIDNDYDHRSGIADEELHDHYTKLLNSADTILYGHKTYVLMQYWQEVLQNPGGNKAEDDFAQAINRISKIVFSHTLKEAGWDTARMAQRSLEEEVAALKQNAEGDILVGSASLIIQLLNLGMVDELQLCLHPVISGEGESLFKDITHRIRLNLTQTKIFDSGAVVLYYNPLH